MNAVLIHEDFSPDYIGDAFEPICAAKNLISSGWDTIEVMNVWGERLMSSAAGQDFIRTLNFKDDASIALEKLAEGDNPIDLWEEYTSSLLMEKGWRKAAARDAISQIGLSMLCQLQAIIDSEDKPSWASLYRKYASYLREVREFCKEHALSANEMVKDLMLEATVPFNDLEAEPEVDSYTGEEVRDDEDYIREDFDGRKVAMEQFAPWNYYISHRKPYTWEKEIRALRLKMLSLLEGADLAKKKRYYRHLQGKIEKIVAEKVKMNDQFYRANNEGYLAVDEEDIYDDEQKEDDLPVYMKPEYPVDVDTWEIIAKVRELRTAMFTWLSKQDDPSYNLKTMFFNRMKARNLALFTMAKHLTLTSKAIIVLSLDNKLTPAEFILSAWADSSHVQKYIQANEDELLDIIASRNGGLREAPELTEEQLDKIAYQCMRDTVSTMPEVGDPKTTKEWNFGYIRAMTNGASFPQANDAAWDHYRHSVSPAGAEAYNLTEGDLKAKWRSFQIEGRKSGEIKDAVIEVLPDKIVTAPLHNPRDRRTVTPRIAQLKANSGEMIISEQIASQAMENGLFVDLISQLFPIHATAKVLA